MADHEPPATPPGNADNTADTPPPLPERIRVHALAKLLGVTSKRLLAHLTEMGSEARTAHSSVNRDVAESVRVSLTEAQQAPVEPAVPVIPAAETPLAQAPTAEPLVAEAPVAEIAAAEIPPAVPTSEAPAAPAPAEPGVAEAESADVTHATLFSSPVITEPAPVEDVVEPALQVPLFLPPETPAAEPRRRRRATAEAGPPAEAEAEAEKAETAPEGEDEDTDEGQPRRRRRGRRGRGRGRGEQATDGEESTEFEGGEAEAGESEDGDEGAEESAEAESADIESTDEDEAAASEGSSRRRRRRRRRKVGGETAGETAGETSQDDPPNTVVHEREPRTKAKAKDEVQGITGSTRLEAKRQRRRDGRDAGRRRPPILSESEFLARRESVERVMVVREKAFAGASEATGNVAGASEATGNVTAHPPTIQVAVLEDNVLVEHFVTSTSSASMVGNVYKGRVQNVLPSMEAAFVDIGRGRNGVLYAGEVNWEAAGLGGKERRIEQALKPGDQVLVQVSKDPVGHKGARLTTQISLAGRFLVYVPGGSSTGISRKLPDTERKRLKEILREIVPPDAGVIIRTASEGVSAEELARDVERLQNQWHRIESEAKGSDGGDGNANPQALYEEPDLLVKVVRDLFNEDFANLVIEGEQAWDTIENYIRTVAPDLLPRVKRHESEAGLDVFETNRIDEQLAKALERKVWLPSGGTLVIDRTEAMTVVDVNTGKFTGAGGNLEETVTRNNLEAAEEVVRQMRLRDIGGMIVVDFIDMVLESNRDLVLRRLTECLGRDRTRHQVSEVTSLGLVQMTRKKLGTGLVEAFSTTCEHCHGRGIVVHSYPVDAPSGDDGGARGRGGGGGGESGGRRRRGRDRGQGDTNGSGQTDLVRHVPEVDVSTRRQHPVALAMAAHHAAEHAEHDVEASKVEERVAAETEEVAVAAEVAEPNLEVAVEAEQPESVEVATVDTVDTVEVATVNTVDTVEVEAPAEPVEDATDATAPRRPGRRRVSRAAAAPGGESSGTVFVIPADEASSDGQPSEVATALRTASVIVPPRPRRRRASGRPAGPPVDADA